MLIESLVKATVDLQGFNVLNVSGDTSGLTARIKADGCFSPRCGHCLQPARYRDTRRERHFRHVPIWGIGVELVYAPRRVSCATCGIHTESMPWVTGKQQITKALMVTLASWARTLSWQQVAQLFDCSWATVSKAVDEAVQYGLAHRDLNDLTHIGILATHSRLAPIRDFAWMLRRHEEGILSYFKMPIDNGTTEGLNNKAKLIVHRAYGFRTAGNYIRNLYHCMADLPLPQITHSFA